MLEAIRAQGYEPELVDVADDGRAYRRLMAGLWSYGTAFTVIEHDVVIRPGALAELATCPEPWCCVPYLNGSEYLVGGLGCTRFSVGLLRSAPALFDEVALLAYKGPPREDWAKLDIRIRQVLEDTYKVFPHAHWPACDDHLNPLKQTTGPAPTARPLWNCSSCGDPIPQLVIASGSIACPGCGMIAS